MTRLPARLKPVRSGILRGPKREWPRHRSFIRKHACIVTLSRVFDDCDGPIVPAHYRTADNAGTGIKPPDWFTSPMCDRHHRLQHQIGQDAFERKYGLDIRSICLEMARISTDIAMKEEMKELGVLP